MSSTSMVSAPAMVVPVPPSDSCGASADIAPLARLRDAPRSVGGARPKFGNASALAARRYLVHAFEHTLSVAANERIRACSTVIGRSVLSRIVRHGTARRRLFLDTTGVRQYQPRIARDRASSDTAAAAIRCSMVGNPTVPAARCCRVRGWIGQTGKPLRHRAGWRAIRAVHPLVDI